jgi:hypothetical protein
MVDFTDPYVVGFSVLLLYILRTSYQARTVWKQLGWVVSDFSSKIDGAKFGSSAFRF